MSGLLGFWKKNYLVMLLNRSQCMSAPGLGLPGSLYRVLVMGVAHEQVWCRPDSEFIFTIQAQSGIVL